MGSRQCRYCSRPVTRKNTYLNHSSGDVRLKFRSPDGREVIYEFPDMVFHYLVDHRAQAPADFVEAVMRWQYLGCERMQTKSAGPVIKSVMYLEGTFETGCNDQAFIDRLWQLVIQGTEDFGQPLRCDEARLKFADCDYVIPDHVDQAILKLPDDTLVVVSIRRLESCPPQPSVSRVIYSSKINTVEGLEPIYQASYCRRIHKPWTGY
jgi:hypothetical protein